MAFPPRGRLTRFPLLQLLIPVTTSIRLKVSFEGCAVSLISSALFLQLRFEAKLPQKWSGNIKDLPLG